MIGYSPHYLMFGCRPRLQVDFYFPTLRSTKVPRRDVSAKYVDEYLATVQQLLSAALPEANAQSMAEAKRQKCYYDHRIHRIEAWQPHPSQGRHFTSFRCWCSLVCWCLLSMGWMFQSHPVKPTPKGSDNKTMPQEDDGLVITLHQTRKTPLGWINGKL